MDDPTRPLPARPQDRDEEPATGDGQLALLALLLSTPDLEAFLDGLAVQAASFLDRPVSCGITVRRERSPMTVASSDALASAVDELQYSRGQGPCLQALETGVSVSVPEMLEETRWGGYPAHALAQGVRSSLSLPMRAAGTVLGALNLYSTQPDGFTDAGVVARAVGFAEQGSAALDLALRASHDGVSDGQLGDALAARTMIDQAIGILMTQHRCPADEAFALLRSSAHHLDRTLRDTATELVAATERPPA